MRRRSWVVVFLAVVLVAGACGGRDDDDGGGDAIGGDENGQDTGTDEPGTGDFGDLEAVCGPAEDGEGGGGGGGGGGEGETQGITPEAIRLGTVSDPGFAGLPGLNQELFDAGDAFVAWCNEAGGINGRQIELTKYDAAFTDYRARMDEACRQEFALVGGGAVQDNLWPETGQACGLIDIAGFAVTPEKTGTVGTPETVRESRVVQPVPNPVDSFPIGQALFIAEEFPDVIERAGILYGDFQTTIIQKDRQVDAYAQAGFEFVYERATNPLGEDNWAPFASDLQDNDVQFLTLVGTGESYAPLLVALEELGYRPEVIQLETNFYDPAYIDAAGTAADGSLIRNAYVPFEEAADNPATQQYIDQVEEIDGKVALLGAQSYSAWLLFATAARDCDRAGTLTRTCVLESTSEVTEWTGGGLHSPANPSENRGPACFMLVEVDGGEFARYHPEDPEADGGFDCGGEEYNAQLNASDYGVSG